MSAEQKPDKASQPNTVQPRPEVKQGVSEEAQPKEKFAPTVTPVNKNRCANCTRDYNI